MTEYGTNMNGNEKRNPINTDKEYSFPIRNNKQLWMALNDILEVMK